MGWPDESFGIVKTKQVKSTALNINQAATDIGTFAGLPAKYRITKFMAYDASINMAVNLATVGLFTAAAGGGSALVALALLQTLTSPSKFNDMTLAIAGDYRTESTLYIRSGVAAGAAATTSFLLEYVDLT